MSSSTSETLLSDVLAAGIAGLALLLVGARPLATNDLSTWIALGHRMLAKGNLADTEIFTCTLHGQTFLHGTWGFSLLSALAFDAVGYDGIRIGTGWVLAATCAIIWALVRREGARAVAVTSLLTFLLLLQNSAPRAQTLSFLLFMLFTALIVLSSSWQASLVGGLVLGWTWGALHGSFVLGLAWAGVMALGRALDTRRLPAVPIAACLGLGIGALGGPYGPRILVYVWTNTLLPQGRNLAEWAPPSLGRFEGAVFFGSLVLWACLLVFKRDRVGWSGTLLVVFFAVAGLFSTRNCAWFGLATALPLARAVSKDAPSRPGMRRRAVLLLALVLGLVSLCIPGRVGFARGTPVALVEELGDQPTGGCLIAPMEWAGFVAERLDRPGEAFSRPYLMDQRVWIYDDATWQRYLDLAAANPGWEATLDDLDVRLLLLSPQLQGAMLLRAARTSPAWEVVQEDANGALLRRRSRQ